MFLQHVDEWFAEWPTLSVVKLSRAHGQLAEVAASPWLAHLRGLDLSDNDIEDSELAYLTSSRFIGLLQDWMRNRVSKTLRPEYDSSASEPGHSSTKS